ncbi:hypothetical protein DIPPA_11128 [Diplonema papillatum]|nr:hypothetical protein DIPPA_11128 [Diplonema papillatum]
MVDVIGGKKVLVRGHGVCRRCAGPWLRALAGEGGQVRCGACGECLDVAEVEAIAHGNDGLKAALKEASVRRCVAQGMAAACPAAGCRGILPKDSKRNVCSECGLPRQSTDA